MKISLRELLLVTVIVALALGWWVDRNARSARIERLNKELKDSEWLPPRGSVRDGFQVDVF